MAERTDFHAHVLPGADHGSDSVETSLLQLSQAAAAGVTKLVATPHFYPDRADAGRFFDRRQRALDTLRGAYTGGVTLLPGAEVFLCEGLQHHPRLQALCAEGTNTLLVEMPNPPWPPRFRGTLAALLELGFRVVLAHIERYPFRDMKPLLAMGCRAQLNAGCLASPLQRGRYLRLIEQGAVWALGSDVHGQDGRAYKELLKAWNALGSRGEALAGRMASLLAPAASIGSVQQTTKE